MTHITQEGLWRIQHGHTLVRVGKQLELANTATPGATGWVCCAKLPAASLLAALPSMLLLHQCYLPPKSRGAHSLAEHPASSLLAAEGDSKPSPHPVLGVESQCGVGDHQPWQRTSC